MGRFIDLTGQKINRWSVLERAPNRNHNTMWLCLCDCGNTKCVGGTALTSGHTKSCGCWRKEKITKHGLSASKTYGVWKHMVQRCTNTKTARYKDYGGRITICDRWNPKQGGSFKNFLEDMGECPPGLSLDRIDNNLGYYQENCRWISLQQQSFNKRNTVKIFYNNKEWCRAELARQFNLRPETLQNRINRGMSIEEALNTPLPKQTRKLKSDKNKSLQQSYNEMYNNIQPPIKNTNPLWKYLNV